MILILNNNKIQEQQNSIIKSSTEEILLKVEDIKYKDCNMIASITLTNGVERVTPFSPLVNIDYLKAIFSFQEDDLPYIDKATLKIIILNVNFKYYTNEITINVDTTQLKNIFTVKKSKDITNVLSRLLAVENKLNAVLTNKVVDNIKVINNEYIQPGMVLVALDNKGNFIAEYPFNNLVNDVNGKEPSEGKVELVAADIIAKNNKSILEYIDIISESLNALNTSILTLTEQQKSLRNDLNDLTLEVEKTKNSSIL